MLCEVTKGASKVQRLADVGYMVKGVYIEGTKHNGQIKPSRQMMCMQRVIERKEGEIEGKGDQQPF